MAEGYSLSKFGTVYILRHGDKMVTVPPKMYKNGKLELHEPVLTTAEGDAYLIKERNGQITFEPIPMATISETDTKDPPVLSQPSTAMPERRNEDHLLTKDSDNKNVTARTINNANKNATDKTVTDFLPEASAKQQESIGSQSNTQKMVGSEGKADTFEQAVGHKRGKVRIYMVNEFSPDGFRCISSNNTTNNDQIPQRGLIPGVNDALLKEVTAIRAEKKLPQKENGSSKDSSVEMRTVKNDEIDGHRLFTDRPKGQSNNGDFQDGGDGQKSVGESQKRRVEEQKNGADWQKNGAEGKKGDAGAEGQKTCVSGQMPKDPSCSDECVEDSEAPDSIKVDPVHSKDNDSVSGSGERLDELEAGSDAALSMISQLRDTSQDGDGRDGSDNSDRLRELEIGSDAAVSMRSQLEMGSDAAASMRSQLEMGSDAAVSMRSQLEMGSDAAVSMRSQLEMGSDAATSMRSQPADDANAEHQLRNMAVGGIGPGITINEKLQQSVDDRHGAGDRSRHVNVNAQTTNTLHDSMDERHFSETFSIVMEELEYMAMQYLFGVEMAGKIKHMKYDTSNGCMVFISNDYKMLNKIKQACTKIRQEKREVILDHEDELILAATVCVNVQKANQRVFCHFIPLKDMIVIFGPDRKDVDDAEHEISVQLGRAPPTCVAAEGGGPSGTGLEETAGTLLASSPPPSGTRYPPDMKEYQRGGLTVKVYTGSILQLPVECIVVSDMPSLRSTAKIVREAAGKNYEDECDRTVKAGKGLKEGHCVMTSAGALTHYKGVVHVYLPTNIAFKEMEQLDKFERNIVKCLETVDGKGFTSVALPCYGTGLYGFSIEKCAQQYFRALDKFSKTAMAVSEVHIVDINPNNSKQVNATFEKNFRLQKTNSSQMRQRQPLQSLSQRTRPSVPDPSKPATFKGTGGLSVSLRNVGYKGTKASFGNHETKPTRLQGLSGSEPYVFYTLTGVQIVITRGDITAADVDAIVSIEDTGFSGTGAIASAILRKSTEDYRSSHLVLKLNFPKRQTKVGQTVYTTINSAQLKCKYVFHAITPHWNKDYTKNPGAFERDLGHTMGNILSRAKETNVYSLGIPLLGASDSREMDTPLNFCCIEMVRSVIQFLKETKVPSLGEIHFVSPDIAAVHSLREEVENQLKLKAEDQGASGTRL